MKSGATAQVPRRPSVDDDEIDDPDEKSLDEESDRKRVRAAQSSNEGNPGSSAAVPASPAKAESQPIEEQPEAEAPGDPPGGAAQEIDEIEVKVE